MNLESINYLCMGCMRMRNGINDYCSVCGFNETVSKASPHQLPVRSILDGRYLIGRVLGEGGFGITYIAYDLVKDERVAIKEYYPAGFVTRNNLKTTTISMFTGEKKDFFLKGKNRFVEEANRLVKFNSAPGIVSISNCIMENSTTYIVMEYIDGFTLKSYLKKMGGRIPAEQIFDMMKPLMSSLVEIHRAGIIHRDISPDNIMITNEGYIKLIDFGAAKDFAGNTEKTMSIRIKPGYSPEEQYRSKGIQGPWTDVYALCATMYRAITGQAPQTAPDRIIDDRLQAPSRIGVNISPYKEAALLKGMAVLQENRYKDIAELYRGLFPNEQLYSISYYVQQSQPAQPIQQPQPVMLQQPQPGISQQPQPVMLQQSQPVISQQPQPGISQQPQPGMPQQYQPGISPQYYDPGINGTGGYGKKNKSAITAVVIIVIIILIIIIIAVMSEM